MVGPGRPVAEDGGMADDRATPAPGTEGRKASLDLHRLDLAEAVLADVEHALARLDAGTWGTCEHCDAPLGQEVLAEAPAARTCGAHA